MITSTLLLAHIASGYIALLSGAGAMLMKKGKGLHAISGRIFYNAMLVISLSALGLSYLKSSAFLFHLAIFAFYQNHSGRKAIQMKSPINDSIDWLISGIAAINAVFMLLHGGVVLMVFGGISLMLFSRDVQYVWMHYKQQQPPKLRWLAKHIGMMMGAYIATITAFLVVNVQFKPAWLIWLGPTFVLVPLMIYWTARYTSPKGGKSINV